MPRGAATLSFLIALTCTSIAFASRAADALELLWSNGSHNITMTAPAPCTLLVRATQATEVLPQAWQLSRAAAASSPLTIREVPSQAGVADVCSFSRGLAPAASASRTDTAFFCSVPGARATIARYVIEIEGNVAAKVKLISTASLQADSASQNQLEVTVNGGAGLDYPPLPLAVHGSQAGDTWTVTVAGADLDRVRSIRYGSEAYSQSRAARAAPAMVQAR